MHHITYVNMGLCWTQNTNLYLTKPMDSFAAEVYEKNWLYVCCFANRVFSFDFCGFVTHG